MNNNLQAFEYFSYLLYFTLLVVVLLFNYAIRNISESLPLKKDG
ncbi:MAG: hypothetical protein U7123_02210 [Potamolinea sp.]